MPKATPPINNFNAGELSPLIDARFDVNKYQNGCRTLQNAVPLVEGGAKKMPGTYFITDVKHSGGDVPVYKKARFVPFSYSTEQAYQLEFGDHYIRFFKDHGQVITNNEDINDFDPSSTHYLGEYTKIGTYAPLSFGTGKYLYVTSPLGQVGASGIILNVTANSSDTLVVSAIGSAITIKLANATPAKNSAALIQIALRALNVVAGIDVTAWTVTETPLYAANRPITSSLSDVAMTVLDKYYREVLLAGLLIDTYPASWVAGAGGWEEVTLGDPVEVYTPYLEADLFMLDVDTQSADVLYIWHSSYPPMTLARHSHINWELSIMSFLGTEDITKTGYGGIGKNIRLVTHVAQAVVTIKEFESGIGAFQDTNRIYINHVIQMEGINQGQYIVDKQTTSTFKIKDPDTLEYFDGSAYTGNGLDGWAVKVVSKFNSAGEYPGCGTFFEQRLCLGGFRNHPLRINLSVSGDYNNFISDPELADGAIQWDLVSSKVDAIRWMVGKQDLMVGTQSGIWKVGASTPTSAMSQTNFIVEKQVFKGVSNVHPQIASDSIVWVTRSASLVHLLQFDFSTNKWISPDLTRIARHITKGATQTLSGITQVCFQSEPIPIFWAIRTDGTLLGLTFEEREQVYAWFRIVTDGLFESVCVTSNDNEEDDITVIVKRVINGYTVRYVEYFKPQEFFSQINDCFFVHSGLTWDGGDAVDIVDITQAAPAVVTAYSHSFSNDDHVKITGVVGMTEINQDIDEAYVVKNKTADTFELYTIDSSGYTAYGSGGVAQKVKKSFTTGLSHLEDKTVDIMVDGQAHGQEIVTDGEITLDYFGNKVHVGLPYTTIVEPMKLNAPSQTTTRGKKQKINRATLCFYETVGGKYGRDQDHLFDIPFGTGVDPVLHTEDIMVDFAGDWADEATISIVHDQPLPFTLKAIIPRVSVNEEQ